MDKVLEDFFKLIAASPAGVVFLYVSSIAALWAWALRQVYEISKCRWEIIEKKIEVMQSLREIRRADPQAGREAFEIVKILVPFRQWPLFGGTPEHQGDRT